MPSVGPDDNYPTYVFHYGCWREDQAGIRTRHEKRLFQLCISFLMLEGTPAWRPDEACKKVWQSNSWHCLPIEPETLRKMMNQSQMHASVKVGTVR